MGKARYAVDVGSLLEMFKIAKKAPDSVIAKTKERAQEVLDEAVALTPIGDGRNHPPGQLRESGKVVKIKRGWKIKFGGPDVPYAYRQHEDTSLNHPQGGQAKFLEQPFVEGISKTIAFWKNLFRIALRKEQSAEASDDSPGED